MMRQTVFKLSFLCWKKVNNKHITLQKYLHFFFIFFFTLSLSLSQFSPLWKSLPEFGFFQSFAIWVCCFFLFFFLYFVTSEQKQGFFGREKKFHTKNVTRRIRPHVNEFVITGRHLKLLHTTLYCTSLFDFFYLQTRETTKTRNLHRFRWILHRLDVTPKNVKNVLELLNFAFTCQRCHR